MNPLEQAIAKIEGGWCTGSLIQDGKVCAVGAIAAVELDIDMREIDRAKCGALTREQLRDLNEKEDAIYEAVDALASTAALYDEIMESGWGDKHINATWNDQATRNNVKDSWHRSPTDAILTFNDEQDDPAVVIEMFKHAAKRLEPKV